jgi:site-specific recombinase XerD
MTWDAWIHAYTDAMDSRGIATSTVDERVRWLWRFEGFCQTHRVATPTAVTPAHVAAYSVSLTSRYTVHTQRMALMGLRGFFRWAMRTQRLLVDPTDFVELPRPDRPDPLFLTPEQVATLLLPVPDETPVQHRNRAMLETLYGTAIRKGECVGADLSDLNLRDGWLRVFGKGRRERLVTVGPHLASVLDGYLAESRPRLLWDDSQTALFVSRDGDRISLYALGRVVHTAAQGIGLAAMGAHALRRSCITHMLAAGADVVALQQLLGHVNLQPTDRYMKLSFEDVQAEHRRTHPRGGFGAQSGLGEAPPPPPPGPPPSL